MKTITTLEQLNGIFEGTGYFALRGISQRDLKSNFKGGDLMSNSLDLFNDGNGDLNRECQYIEGCDELNGTSGISVNEYMSDNELLACFKTAKEYAENHHETGIVYLISGKSEEYGDDAGEVILNNNNFTGNYGAMVIAKVEISE